jgi:hypothetical protein
MDTFLLDVRSTDPRWPQLNETALQYAYAVAEQDRAPWCLFTSWRHEPEFSAEDNWGYVGWVSNLLPPDTDSQILVAHYRGAPGSRTRIEPWIFATGDVDRALVEFLLRRHAQDLAFWSDGRQVHAVTPGAMRCLGEFRHGAIAHAICESSTERASFLAFDLPVFTWIEALARTACVGAASASKM